MLLPRDFLINRQSSKRKLLMLIGWAIRNIRNKFLKCQRKVNLVIWDDTLLIPIARMKFKCSNSNNISRKAWLVILIRCTKIKTKFKLNHNKLNQNLKTSKLIKILRINSITNQHRKLNKHNQSKHKQKMHNQ